MVRVSVSMNGVQLLSPSALRTTRICGRSIMTSAISKRRISSGSSRRLAVSTSTLQRRLAGAAALEADIMKRDIAAGKHRDVDTAVDDQFEAGHGADLRFHRLTQGVPVEQPGHRDQADQHNAETAPRSASRGVSFLGPSSMTYPELGSKAWLRLKRQAGVPARAGRT